MPPDLALLSTLIGLNFPCLELIFMVPEVFEPLKFDCTCYSVNLLVLVDSKGHIGPHKSKKKIGTWLYVEIGQS